MALGVTGRGVLLLVKDAGYGVSDPNPFIGKAALRATGPTMEGHCVNYGVQHQEQDDG